MTVGVADSAVRLVAAAERDRRRRDLAGAGRARARRRAGPLAQSRRRAARAQSRRQLARVDGARPARGARPRLRADTIDAFVDLAGLGPGRYNLRVQVDPSQKLRRQRRRRRSRRRDHQVTRSQIDRRHVTRLFGTDGVRGKAGDYPARSRDRRAARRGARARDAPATRCRRAAAVSRRPRHARVGRLDRARAGARRRARRARRSRAPASSRRRRSPT